MEQAINPTRKIIYITFGVAATGLLGYFGWNYYQKHKNNNNSDAVDFDSEIKDNNFPAPAYKPTSIQTDSNEFPIQNGSKGEKVKAIQQALINKYGSTILPKYGADGSWGNEMDTALQKVHLPMLINESTYNLLVKGTSPNSDSLAQTLVNAAISRNFNQVMASLKQLRNTDDYAKISSQFKLSRVKGVHQTLVNGLISAFSSEDQKQQIRMEFLRMGLKYDGNKWALNGIEKKLLITTIPTWVYVSKNQRVQVPAQVVLGTESKVESGIIFFENNNNLFAVAANTVRYF